ncbi:hypothetical protein MasN3_15770 [Massilia varians]|uniref:Uncharacterized protein n=1 Tax=Massilia varians TaxID=457921 RepID=A0ABN6TC05_9BURK|nr:hypothetical protein [Massilia varians]BDT58083.1 hypothetical protein MasN3_15770 [Massilia varians]
MKMTTVTAIVTDTNRCPRGVMPVQVEFDAYGPVRVKHAGQTYSYTGKEGAALIGTLRRARWPPSMMLAFG